MQRRGFACIPGILRCDGRRDEEEEGEADKCVVLLSRESSAPAGFPLNLGAASGAAAAPAPAPLASLAADAMVRRLFYDLMTEFSFNKGKQTPGRLTGSRSK